MPRKLSELEVGENVQVALDAIDTFVPIDAPAYRCTSTTFVALGSEFVLQVMTSRMGELTLDGETRAVAKNEPTALIHMSPQGLKDLSIILAQVLDEHEKEWGMIETPFTRKHAAAT